LLKEAQWRNLLINVQANHFNLIRYTQVHVRNILKDVEQNASDDKRVSADGSDFRELLSDLNAVSVNATGSLSRAVERRHPGLGKDSGQEGAHHTADAVKLEDIHALVDIQPFVDILHQCAYNAS
jgi:hypothetical protein